MSNIFEPYIHNTDHRGRMVENPSADVGFEDQMADPEDAESSLIKRDAHALKWFVVFALAIVGILVAKSAHLQVFENAAYEELASGNRNRLIPIVAPRGIIFDRFGVPLVKNNPSFDAVMIPVDLPRSNEDKTKIVERVSKIIEKPVVELQTIVNESKKISFEPVLLKENITRDQALMLEAIALETPGVRVDKTSVREYPQKDLLSHALGYVGKLTREEYDEKRQDDAGYLFNDSIGKSGLEKSYEFELRGIYGKKQVEVDSKGNIQKTLATQEPVAGENIVLSVDLGLQEKLREELAKEVDRAGVSRAVAVAMDPRNGEVLAMVNIPSFDNNLFSEGIKSEEYQKLLDDENKPLFNKAIAGTYPPGSTFKPFVATAALEEGIVTPSTTVNSVGHIDVGAWSFYDYDLGGHGVTDLNKAISKSVNTYFYYIGGGYQGFTGLGIERIKKYANLFGFGDYVGLDFDTESKGLIPSPAWKEENKGESWYIGDTYNSSIGQGDVTTTPLQLATAYCAIANEGTLFKPHFLHETFTSDAADRAKKEPEVIRKDFVSKTSLQEVKRAMRETVIAGSGRSLEPLGIEAAGKTGTAQFIIPNSNGQKASHAWFATFAPASDPKIVLIVLVEAAGEGHEHAVPVARETLKWYFSRGDVENKLDVNK